MHFTKMQGLGNDYLYVCADAVPEEAAALSVRLSERHFGAGADGMIWILPSECADFRMRIFNADGSEAEMCGNGIRCVGKLVYEKGLTQKTALTVETLAGIRRLTLFVEDGRVKQVSVDMGQAQTGEAGTLTVAGRTLRYIPVSMGNPHAVIFTEDAEAVPLAELGPQIEHHAAFPKGVNAEFVQVTGKNTLRMRVWERGSGITMACGTGACAAAAAAVREGQALPDADVSVILDGGILHIRVDGKGHVTMTGPAETVYEGETV